MAWAPVSDTASDRMMRVVPVERLIDWIACESRSKS
jgi:hypothetical protein